MVLMPPITLVPEDPSKYPSHRPVASTRKPVSNVSARVIVDCPMPVTTELVDPAPKVIPMPT